MVAGEACSRLYTRPSAWQNGGLCCMGSKTAGVDWETELRAAKCPGHICTQRALKACSRACNHLTLQIASRASQNPQPLCGCIADAMTDAVRDPFAVGSQSPWPGSHGMSSCARAFQPLSFTRLRGRALTACTALRTISGAQAGSSDLSQARNGAEGADGGSAEGAGWGCQPSSAQLVGAGAAHGMLAPPHAHLQALVHADRTPATHMAHE